MYNEYVSGKIRYSVVASTTLSKRLEERPAKLRFWMYPAMDVMPGLGVYMRNL